MQRFPAAHITLESRMRRSLSLIGAATASSCSAFSVCSSTGAGSSTTAFLHAVGPPPPPPARAIVSPALTGSFHSSPPLFRKNGRSKWKAAKRYAAERNDNYGEEDDADDGRATTAGTSENESSEHIIYDPPDDAVESKSLHWIRNVVIGLNLCPFAASPLQSDRLTCQVVRGTDDETIASAVLLELILRVDTPGTTVVVAPECHPDEFETYLEVVSYVEGTLMEEHDLCGKVQLAPFHPLFEFGGSGPDGVDNYTNRSPFPMFHVLREEEVSAAVDKLDGDAGKVWRRNVRLMEGMDERFGRDAVERVMGGNGEDVPGLDDLLSDIKDDEEE